MSAVANLLLLIAPWSQEVRKAWPYATQTAMILFAVAAFSAAFVAWQNGAQSTLGYVLGVVDPALVATLMIVSCVFAPGAYLGSAFRGVHVVTLPTLFVSGVAAMKIIGSQTPSIVRRFDNVQRFDLIWTNWKFLFIVWGIMCLTIALLGALRYSQAPEGK